MTNLIPFRPRPRHVSVEALLDATTALELLTIDGICGRLTLREAGEGRVRGTFTIPMEGAAVPPIEFEVTFRDRRFLRSSAEDVVDAVRRQLTLLCMATRAIERRMSEVAAVQASMGGG